MSHPTVILRKSSVCKKETVLYKKGYDCAEDYKLWTDLATKGFQFANIQEVLLKYRCSKKQVTNVRYEEMQESELQIKVEYLEQVMQHIVKQEENYFDLFESIIKLSNQSYISVRQLSNIVYLIYTSFN